MMWRYVVVLSLLVLAGCVVITDEGGGRYEVRRGESGLVAVEKESSGLLKALVKGSIYETGEFVSVFGTCLNATDGGYLGSYATMSSWYPNGTEFFSDVAMSEIQTGYFVYTGFMEAVQGTYLTELQCHVNGSDVVAKAFGEWQNPLWVARINETQAAVGEVQVQIGDLNVTMQNNFEQTWGQINDTYVNVSNQLTYVATVANNSVDRNDSYIVQLIQQIIANGTPTTGPAGSVSFTEVTSPVFFRQSWNINVTAFIGATQVGSDYVACYINTTNSPNTVAAQMEPIPGPMFTYSEMVRSIDFFDWDVWCVTA